MTATIHQFRPRKPRPAPPAVMSEQDEEDLRRRCAEIDAYWMKRLAALTAPMDAVQRASLTALSQTPPF